MCVSFLRRFGTEFSVLKFYAMEFVMAYICQPEEKEDCFIKSVSLVSSEIASKSSVPIIISLMQSRAQQPQSYKPSAGRFLKPFPAPKIAVVVAKVRQPRGSVDAFYSIAHVPQYGGSFFVGDMHLPSRVSHICAHHVAVVCISLLGVVPAAASLPLDSACDKTVRS